jgi:hypothetical protein
MCNSKKSVGTLINISVVLLCVFGFPTGLVLLRELPLSPPLGCAVVSGTACLLGQRLWNVKMPSLVQPAMQL